MSAYLPSSGKGDVNWRDLTDNWTHADTAWLQERTVTRIGNSYTLGTPGTSGDNVLYNINEGRLFYNIDTKVLAISDGTTLNTVFKSSGIKITDGSTSSEILGVSAASNTGVTISKTGASVSIGSAATFSSTVGITGALTVSDYLTSLKAGSSGSISTDSTGFVINTSGSNAVTVTTSTAVGSATTLEINSPVKITGSLTTTTGITAGGVLVVSGTGTSTIAGDVTIASGKTLTSPTVTATTTTNTVTLSASGLITAGAGISVTGGSIQSSSDLVLSASSAIRTISSFVYGDTSAGKNSNIKNAWSIYAASDPATATITNKALSTNVATLTTGSAHNLWVGASVTVSGVDSTFNGTYTVTGVPSTTTFTYAKTAGNVSSTAVSPVGAVTIPIPDGTIWFS